jgi:hypothetical protein
MSGHDDQSHFQLSLDGAISQLHSIRNGYNRPTNAIQRQNHKTNWTTLQWQMQQQQQQQQQAHGGMNYSMHMDQMQMQIPHKSSAATTTTGSPSESGSSGDVSPPPPPTQSSSDPSSIHGNINQSQSSGIRNKQALNLNRLNGGSGSSSSGGGNGNGQNQLHQTNSSNSLDFNGTSQTNPNVATTATLVSSSSSGNLLHIGGPMHNYPTYRNMPGTATIQRQFPVNGEISIFPFSPGATFIAAAQPQVVANVLPTQQAPQSQQRVSPAQTPPVILPTPYPTNKLVQSCFNCGSINHTGLNCSEASMEDVTRNAVYKLDYTVSTQSAMMQQFAAVPAMMMTPSSSSGNLSNQMQGSSSSNSNQPAVAVVAATTNNSEPEPSITFIDLTQDTSSDSSISNR